MIHRKCVLLDIEEVAHQMCSFVWADNFWIVSQSKNTWSKCFNICLKKASKVDLEPKPVSLRWTRTYALED